MTHFNLIDQTTFEQVEHDQRQIVRWLALAVGSLVVAGLFAVFLVLGRTPGIAERLGDPLLFKRCLVVHVNLSLVLWFYCFLGVLYHLMPVKQARRQLATVAVAVSAVGMLAMMAAAAAQGAIPVLSNYIPAIDHPLFVGGLFLFGMGLVMTFMDGRLEIKREAFESVVSIPSAARPGLRAAAIAFLLAMTTFVLSALSTTQGLPVDAYYELLFWGGGHILQVASVMAMVSIWIILIASATGEAPVTRRVSANLFVAMLIPISFGPLLAMQGTGSATYYGGFTTMMRWGIFPTVLVFIVMCIWALKKAHRPNRRLFADRRIVGTVVSICLTLLGFVLGAMIDGSNTIVPAHYHAAIGAVTVAFMTVTYELLAPLGYPLPTARLKKFAAWQPLVFGVGQTIFAFGFAMAGAHGAARKAYATAQQTRSVEELVGLSVMATGGAIATTGGILFLWIVIATFRSQKTVHSQQEWRLQWLKIKSPNTQSSV